MSILEYLDKNNLHHAYLIEGARSEIVPEITKFLKSLGINTIGNSDFIHINLDTFKIEDARNLKSYGNQKSFSPDKKIFIISANSFLLEAQNSLLKMFEEPIENTHFFLIVPDINALLKTFISRFYLIKAPTEVGAPTEVREAENFINLPLRNRIDFIKELLIEPEEEDEEGNEIVILPARNATHSVAGGDSTRSKALKFLNELEAVIHSKLLKNSEWCGSHSVIREGSSQKNSSITCLQHLFKVRKLLRMPGSSAKSLMESVALVVPYF